MKYIKVTIDRESGEISVTNDGKGIPVEIHEKEGVYVPQMVFGELLTGDNYNDGEDRVVGGRNGYGASSLYSLLSIGCWMLDVVCCIYIYIPTTKHQSLCMSIVCCMLYNT